MNLYLIIPRSGGYLGAVCAVRAYGVEEAHMEIRAIMKSAGATPPSRDEYDLVHLSSDAMASMRGPTIEVKGDVRGVLP